MDTENKRSSAVHVALPWRAHFAIPDGTISRFDRFQAAAFYASPIVNITSTALLHKPVDYALAGDQDSPVRRGRAAGRGLRHTFGE
jgi:hypothetical protein